MAEQEFTKEELEQEEWRDVAGFVGVYSVSDLGRVRRDKRACGTQPGRILKARLDVYGYPYLSLNWNGKQHTFKVHRLIGHAFPGTPPSDAPQINHMDGNKTNNRAQNLEYCNNQQNGLHASRLGLLPSGDCHPARRHPEYLRRGEANHKAKLTANKVCVIRQQYESGLGTLTSLAREYGVTKQSIRAIVLKETWAHI